MTKMVQIKLPFFSIIFRLLCFLGFVYQVIQISQEFFAYRTTTTVILRLGDKNIDPSIIFCTRCTDILDRKNYEEYGIYAKSNFNYTEVLSDVSKLTIKDIFDLTPAAEDVVIGCQIRKNAYDVNSYSQDECYSLFRVTKYVEGMFVCYQFSTTMGDSKFHCDEASRSYFSVNELYGISLKQLFFFSNTIKVISFIPKGFNNSILNMPFTSRRFYVLKLRYNEKHFSASTLNYMYISGDLYIITRLEKPYDTKCIKNEENADFNCRRRCNINAFKAYNIFPPNEFTVNPLPIKTLNPVTLKNETLIEDVKLRNDRCVAECTENLCHDWYTVSNLETLPLRRSNTLSIVSRCSTRPTVVIQHLPRITFMEFILYISSSLGIWFGVSIISVNPFGGNSCTKIAKRRKIGNTTVYHLREMTARIEIQESEIRHLKTTLNNMQFRHSD